MGLLLSFLPWTGFATFFVMLWALHRAGVWKQKAADWRGKWEDANRAALEANFQLAGLQEDVKSWKSQALAARTLCLAAQSDAKEIKAKFEALHESIAKDPVPPDAEGALTWLADKAKQITEATR